MTSALATRIVERQHGDLKVSVSVNGRAKCPTVALRVHDDGKEEVLQCDDINPVLRRERIPFISSAVATKKERRELTTMLLSCADEIGEMRELQKTEDAKGKSPSIKAIDNLNQQYAVIKGGSGGILRQTTRDDGQKSIDIISAAQFRVNEMPQQILVGGKETPIAEIWLKSGRRREYEGLCFRPNNDAPAGYFNLWTGFGVEPSEKGSCQRYIDHVAENVCGGDESHFAWLMGFFAQIIQEPAKKTGTAVAVIGPQGAGKSIVGEPLRSILGPHYMAVADPRFVIGRFNSHVIDKLLLQVDEGFWGGDHAVDGKLKDIITGAKHQVEYKGREPYTVDNHVRLYVTSNQQRVIPAAYDQRRFAVFEVSAKRANDHKYFGALSAELENGGYAALLHYLKAYDLSDINLRQPPKTDALLRQKTQSASAEESWWLDVLQDGRLPGSIDRDTASCKALYSKYLETSQLRKVGRPVASETLGHFLRKVAPGVERKRLTVAASSPREWCYLFPALQECRKAFDVYAGQAFDWSAEADKWE